MTVLLVQGDARHLPLADGVVACCVTSPPFLGLRDYGTGQWVGGEAGCTHQAGRLNSQHQGNIGPRNAEGNAFRNSGRYVNQGDVAKATCGRCGAVRVDRQIGLEERHDCAGAFTGISCGQCWICQMRQVMQEVWRVLAPWGTVFLNCGDAYNSARGGAPGNLPARTPIFQPGEIVYRGAVAGLKPKSLLGLPWRLALALQQDGWLLRSAITLCKVAPMPESVRDRPTSATEMLFLLAKQGTYFYDAEAVRVHGGSGWRGPSFTSAQDVATKQGLGLGERCEQTGRNLWNYWHLSPEPTSFQHYATFSTALVRTCLKAGCPTQVCSACGAPWVRGRTQIGTMQQHWAPGTQEKVHIAQGQHGRTSVMHTGHVACYEPTAPAPSCACNAPPRPARVLDPFAGSGTVGLLARELGHDAVLVDLSWPYLATIARERLGLAALHRWAHGDTPRVMSYADLPLFAKDAPCP